MKKVLMMVLVLGFMHMGAAMACPDTENEQSIKKVEQKEEAPAEKSAPKGQVTEKTSKKSKKADKDE